MVCCSVVWYIIILYGVLYGILWCMLHCIVCYDVCCMVYYGVWYGILWCIVRHIMVLYGVTNADHLSSPPQYKTVIIEPKMEDLVNDTRK